uniref:RING-type domain-containing protein n=1 Tax=Cynoglossus semilaevis TaxID=244447 RepID=A0A3P8VR66_CYNSE
MDQQKYLDQKRFCCSICLDLLNDPVAIPCGHSYCKVCIEGHWKTEDEKYIYTCPQCRKTFRRRPDLEKNIMLADLLQIFERSHCCHQLSIKTKMVGGLFEVCSFPVVLMC